MQMHVLNVPNGKPIKMSKFQLGRVTGTLGALTVLAEHYTLPQDLLVRHHNCDWGDLEEEDKECNDTAIADGSRIFSAYVLAEGVKVWIITEAKDDDRRAFTTVLLPEEY